MSQRYFLTTESAYERLRLELDAQLGYPKADAVSIFTPALQSPRDSLRRIVLAVDDGLPHYAEIVAKIDPLLTSASAQELTESEYLAFLVCVSEGTGAATFTTVSDTLTYTNFQTTPGTLADALSGIDSAISGKANASDFDQGVTTTDSPEFAGVEFNAYTVGWKIEPRSSLGGAFDFKATLSGVTTTVFSVANNGVVGDCSIPWSLLTSIPSTFAPSAHNQAWSTITSTPTTLAGYGITDAASQSHAHSAADVTSGVFDVALLPVGTGSTQVAAGNHTHTQLHDRSHAITSTSDHTAGNWKVLYTNGSGQVVELGLGDSGKALISNGASAAPSWATAGSNSASDLTTGTLGFQRLPSRVRSATSLYLWSSFR